MIISYGSSVGSKLMALLAFISQEGQQKTGSTCKIKRKQILSKQNMKTQNRVIGKVIYFFLFSKLLKKLHQLYLS